MIGGRFDEHPWDIIEARIVVDDRTFPATRHLPPSFVIQDEHYQIKDFSREKMRILARLDPGSVDLKKPLVHRTDGDFPVAWAKDYGKGQCVLFDARPRCRDLGQPDGAHHVLRSHEVGARARPRCDYAHPETLTRPTFVWNRIPRDDAPRISDPDVTCIVNRTTHRIHARVGTDARTGAIHERQTTSAWHLGASCCLTAATLAQNDWKTYMGTIRATRDSPRSPRSRRRTSRALTKAWEFDTKTQGRKWQNTAVVINSIMYITLQNGGVVALEPETGRELWRFETPVRGRSVRAIACWPGDDEAGPRLL